MVYLVLLIIEIFVLYLLKRKVTRRIYNLVGTYIFAILFLPGTFIHEISHFLTALFLLVPVGQIELMPERIEGGIKMGSVPIGKTDPVRRTLIGVAQIIFGLGIILGTIYYVYSRNLFNNPIALIITSYIAFEVGNTMFSSKEDMEGVLPLLVVLIIFYAILYFIGVRISLNINPDIFKMADIFLLVPIGIDALFLI